MLKPITTVIISLLIVVGVSYGASHYIVAPAAENAKDAGIQTIEKEIGEDFEIILEANPTTGYQWTVKFDPEYLKMVEQKYLPDFSEDVKGAMLLGEGRTILSGAPEGAREVAEEVAEEQWVQDQIDEGVVGIENPEESEMEVPVGAGGQESFKFLTLKKGETEIKFSYERSWEEEPIETLTYKVVIK
ncbi:unnamed protein product [marine sediment metagenome]|uniref:Proteinase inhibitor I42 chagasin domain-containing protein n=1 Tax=marine sediment metagenome TaxID=412755 RepID=X1I0S1_9ZZZZ